MAAIVPALSAACGGDDTGGGEPRGVPGGATGGGPFVQGHVVSRAPLVGEAETLSAVVSDGHYDRCDAEIQSATLTASRVMFQVPARPGSYDTAYIAVGPGGPGVGPATVEITYVDEYRVEGRIDAGSGRSGGFVLDTCGHFGRTAASLEPCSLTESISVLAAAISPKGRIAVSDVGGANRVFRRKVDGAGCSYEPDPDYGSGGVPGIVTRALHFAFDAQERLYAATSQGAFDVGAAGSLVRVTPGGATEACLNEAQPSASVTDSAPDNFVVLRDGSVAYGWWGGLGERRIDLTSPTLGSGLVECSYEVSADDLLRYAAAISSHDGGLLFLRRAGGPDGPVHAEATDIVLSLTLCFGGTISGRGAAGFASTGAGARCPLGYCMASAEGLAVFSSEGEYRHFTQWYTVLSGKNATKALAATEGADGDAYVLLEHPGGLTAVRITPK